MKSTILTIAIAMIASFALAADDKKPDGKGKGRPDGKVPEAAKVDPSKRAETMMKQLDGNGDGKVTKEEFAASDLGARVKEKGGDERVDRIFSRLDADQDQHITKEELAKIKPLDGNGDGKVTREEFAASDLGARLKEKHGDERVDSTFSRLDVDQDQSLTISEQRPSGHIAGGYDLMGAALKS